MTVPIKPTCSWILKRILQQRETVQGMLEWQQVNQGKKFQTRNFYYGLLTHEQQVFWHKLFYDNMVRPRENFILWLVCHDRLATRERLMRFGIINHNNCVFCNAIETLDNLLFQCDIMNKVWKYVLNRLQMEHEPGMWHQELEWVIQQSKSRHWQARMLRATFTKVVYIFWKYRNDMVHGNIANGIHIGQKIIDILAYRLWMRPKIRQHVASLLLA
ncbi:uncharacterized protein LOC131650366 [Vicia villosa]|uniref:uncharacterized protein LOC131650366 n=1 Tax=Vicia villosa TaxID=3911 RepID=UPI00273C6A2E|nr:uncharacterized protein LOC131650366 [Vicia villosa]